MTPVTTVPFSRLVAIDGINARASGGKDGLDELAASIAAKGLLQSICVRPATEAQKYEIIDGRRRWQALARLVKDKVIKRDFPVPVLVRDEDDADALESSLMANVVRLPMHPVDQYEVLVRLAGGPGNSPGGEPAAGAGLSNAEIAARFGLAERTVRQQLALGRLAPEVRQAWRKGRIDADTAQAFAVHPDPAVQAAALARLGKHLSPWAVRHELADTRARADQSDELALVGEAAYLAAGGTIEDDLFTEARYVTDVPLARKLARDLLQAKCRDLTDAGWAWAEITDEVDFSEWDCDHVLGEAETEETDETHDFTPEQKARAGCLVSIESDSSGASIRVLTGLIRPERAAGSRDTDEADDDGQTDLEDVTDDHPAASGAVPAAESEAASDDPFDISDALRITIHEAMTVAASQAIRENPIIALQVLVAQLECSSSGGPVKITDTGNAVVSDRHKRDYRKTFADRLRQVKQADADALLIRLAVRVAQALSLVPSGSNVYNGTTEPGEVYALRDYLPAADYLAAMREAFSPADYFTRARKATAIAALEEMHDGGHHFGLQGREDLDGMKKAALAEWAAEQAKASGWLPPQLRHKAYALLLPEKPAKRGAGGRRPAGDAPAPTQDPSPAPNKKRARA